MNTHFHANTLSHINDNHSQNIYATKTNSHRCLQLANKTIETNKCEQLFANTVHAIFNTLYFKTASIKKQESV